MTTERGRGRPQLTDQQAWWSLRKRFLANVDEVQRKGVTGTCVIWNGPVTLHIAGDRGVISPANFMLAEWGYDLCRFMIADRICLTRNCLEPEHWSIQELGAGLINSGASWHPHPIPGESPEEKTTRLIEEKRAKEKKEWTGIRG